MLNQSEEAVIAKRSPWITSYNPFNNPMCRLIIPTSGNRGIDQLNKFSKIIQPATNVRWEGILRPPVNLGSVVLDSTQVMPIYLCHRTEAG